MSTSRHLRLTLLRLGTIGVLAPRYADAWQGLYLNVYLPCGNRRCINFLRGSSMDVFRKFAFNSCS